MQEKIDFYTKILSLSKEISLLIKLESFERINDVLKKREILLKEINKNDFNIEEIKEIVEKIKILDDENCEKLKNKKNQIYVKLKTIIRKKTLISSYKQKGTDILGVIDEKR